MEQASRARSEKLDNTQQKLDLFYSNMELVRKHQNLGGVVERAGLEGGVAVAVTREKRTTVEADYESEANSVNATPVSDSELDSADGTGSKQETNLELELEQALSRLESDTESTEATNDSNKTSDEVQQTRSNFRLVLKPLPPNDGLDGPPSLRKQQGVACEGKEGCVCCLEQCPNQVLLLFQYPGSCSRRGVASKGETRDSSAHQRGGSDETGSDETGSEEPHNLVDELAMFDHIEQELIPDTDPKDLQNTPHKEYPLAYHTLEFLPYNPLPDRLEAVLFPRQLHAPLPLFNDPYWPRKRDCLQLVNEMKNNPKLSSFTGSFISPEARGIR